MGSYLSAVQGVLPAHCYPQEALTAMFADVVGAGVDGQPAASPASRLRPVIERLHSNAGVSQRYLAQPIDWYRSFSGFTEANDVFVEVALELGSRAVEGALAAAGLTPTDVDLVVSATVTGLAVPSLESRIAARLGMRTDVKRLPLVGLGCVAGAAGIARCHDYLLGHPGEVAVLVAVELCSLTVQRADVSTANLIASGLFGDGAAAVVLSGADRPPATVAPRVLRTRSRQYADTERAMGWDVGETGLRIVLGVEVPELVRTEVRSDVDAFLAQHGLSRNDIHWWVAHPGGPKVLDAMAEALEVGKDALQVTWDSLDRIGNLSSASVLHVLQDTLRDRPPEPGTLGLLLAMGPGFCLELVLLQAG